jgi:hypothetical protein
MPLGWTPEELLLGLKGFAHAGQGESKRAAQLAIKSTKTKGWD